jgi:hypothetical protein
MQDTNGIKNDIQNQNQKFLPSIWAIQAVMKGNRIAITNNGKMILTNMLTIF